MVGVKSEKQPFLEAKVPASKCKCTVIASICCFNIDICIVRNNTAVYGVWVSWCIVAALNRGVQLYV